MDGRNPAPHHQVDRLPGRPPEPLVRPGEPCPDCGAGLRPAEAGDALVFGQGVVACERGHVHALAPREVA